MTRKRIYRGKGDGPHAPTAKSRREVVLMLCAGMDPDEVAYVLKVKPAEFAKIYYDEVRYGVGQAAAKVAANLFKIATSFTHNQGANAAMFWLRAKAGWVDRNQTVTMRHEKSRLDELSNDELLAIVGQAARTGDAKLH